MVRHEAAEALGGITSDEKDGKEVLAVLREWSHKADAPVVVKQSCEVAVDMWEVNNILKYFRSSNIEAENIFFQYENSDQFQYADGLEKLSSTAQAAA